MGTPLPWQHPKAALHPQGPLAVVVTYGGDQIPKSPFPVTVAPPLQLGKVKVQGLNSSKLRAPKGDGGHLSGGGASESLGAPEGLG